MAELQQMLQTPNGRYSSTRVCMILSTLIVSLIWGYVSISKDTIVEIPKSVLIFVGLFAGGKAVQGFSEKTTTATSNVAAAETSVIK